MMRKAWREMVLYLAREGIITDIGEFARLFHLANKLPRKSQQVKG
jgi:hypothetical protein